MSNRRSASTRKAELKRRTRDRHSAERVGYSDGVFGIEIRRLNPGGGAERLQVRWNVDRDAYFALQGLDRLQRGVLDGLAVELVTELRNLGHSWDDIGWCLQITGEAARLRYRERVTDE
jgi:hypothetical protein